MSSAAPVAAILRRGPTDWCQVIRWQTGTDTFTDGSWFHGRIYGEKCDVSPDGELFLYFCFQGSRLGTDYTDSWTAVSRLPWLHALGLWPSGTTYGGGGRFITNRKIAIRDGRPLEPHPDHPAEGLEAVRMQDVDGAPSDPADGYPPSLRRRRSADLVDGADWSGRDHGGDIVYCRDGKLFRRTDGDDVELADFSDREPDPQPPPDAATQPLA
jgi:hypothetical protein